MYCPSSNWNRLRAEREIERAEHRLARRTPALLLIMKLYILRHGDAVEHGDSRYKENERPLTPKGLQRTKQLTHTLRQMEISFDAILSSPLIRARQTAEIVARGLDGKVELIEHLTPAGSMEKL